MPSLSSLFEHPLTIVDIETTGLNVIEHEIIEVGCVIVDNKLKTIGIYEVSCKLGHSVNATLKIDIIAG